MSLRDQILATDDRPFEDIRVPEWGLVVRVGTMSAADRDTWEAEALMARSQREGSAKLRNLRAALVARCALDPETGERIFADEDVEKLGAKGAKPVDRLFTVAARLNAVGDDDIRQLEKNSDGDPSDASLSALRWLRVAWTWIGSFPNFRAGRSPSGSSSSGSRVIH